ncbi:MAG: DivIVA domain-containing protein [Bacteroidia bacterium]
MITPIEIRKQSFRKSLRGYDPEEVHAFLQTLSDEWEQQQHELRQMQTQFDQLQADYNSLKKVENMLHKTLLQAEQSATQTLDNAQQKAMLKIEAAEAQAREIVRRSEDSILQLNQDIDKLESRKEEIVLHLEVFLKSQLDRLRAFERRGLPAMGYSYQPEPEPELPPRQEIPPAQPAVPPLAEIHSPEPAIEKQNPQEENLFFSQAEEADENDFSDDL